MVRSYKYMNSNIEKYAQAVVIAGKLPWGSSSNDGWREEWKF
jgi:hypothetical protein